MKSDAGKKRISVLVVLLVIVGFGGLTQFSDGVRTVQVLGLFFSGTIVGVCFARVAARFHKNQGG